MILAFKLSDIIQVPFGWLLNFLYEFTTNYGVALIIFAFLVKLVLLPASAKAKKSSMKMSRLSPLVKALQEKYASDPQRQSAELSALYKKEGVSLGGSCLWSLLPLFVLIPLYSVVRQPLQYLLGETAEVANAICTLVGVDPKTNAFAQLHAAAQISADPAAYAEGLKALGASADTMKGLRFDFLGIDLGAIPQFNVFAKSFWNWSAIGGFLIALLSAGSQLLSMFVSQKMNNSLITDKNGVYDQETAKNSQMNKQNNMMLWMMPIISLWIGFTIPCALSLYWFAQGIFSLVTDIYLTQKYRKIYDAEDAVRLAALMEQEAIEAEKERIRAERRAANPDGITQNTSKKKQQQAKQAQQEAERAAAAKEYAMKKGMIQEDAAEETQQVLSGVTDRPFCKGRAYDPTRYNANTEEN